jgi:hypothetical protein
MSQDIQSELDTPFERLAALPNMMSWAGEWNANDEYFLNFVVTDPITTGSYIYTGFSSSIRGGLPPSQVIGPSIWTAFGSTVAAGVQSLKEGDGILINGSDTTPTVSNIGVLELTAEGGLTNIGTIQFPIIILDNSVSQVQPGLGIDIDNTDPTQPQINNTGILNIFPGEGISVTGDNDLTLENSGVISIGIAPGTALTISNPGQNPTINSTGVVSITEGIGIAKEPGLPANEPQLNNTGVISIVPRDSYISITGGFPGPGNKELKLVNSIRTIVFSGPLTMVPSTIVGINSSAIVNITQTPGTLWESVMLTGSPYSDGKFMLNFGLKFTATLDGNSSLNRPTVNLFLQDNTQNPPVELQIPNNVLAKGGPIEVNNTSRSFLFPDASINVAQVRALGFRRLTSIRVFYGATFVLSSTLRLTTSSNCWATYFFQNQF